MVFTSTQLVYLTLVVSLVGRADAAYILNVRVHSFEGNDKCPQCFDFLRPGCCDNFRNTRFCNGIDRCDNFFFYCLRPLGTVTSLNAGGSNRCGENDRFGKLSGINTNSAPLNFSQDHLLGLPNPVPLRGPTTRWNGVQVYVEVRDADYGSVDSDEFIDRFPIDVDRIPIGNETTPTVYNGTFGFASLTLSFRVDCLLSFYYPACEANGCQNFGNCTCFPGYTGVDCEEEIDECVEANCPENTICVDELNSFTCEPLGTISPPVTDDCKGVNCSGRGRCVDGADSFQCVCDTGYTGGLCETLLSTTNEIVSPRAHVILCIVAVILVISVVTVITIIQFVMIRKNRLERKDKDKVPGPPVFPNSSYNARRDATPTPNSERKSAPTARDESHAAVEENVAEDRMEVNPSYNEPVTPNVEEDIAEVQMNSNVGYNAPITPATPDSNNRGIRPSAEDAKYASRVPNVRPRQLYIYNTPPPDFEMSQMANNPNNHPQPSEDSNGLSEDSNAPNSELPINGGITVSSGNDSGIPSSDVEASPRDRNECDIYFPSDAVPTKDSPTYSRLANPDAAESKTLQQTDSPENTTVPEAPTETPV